MAGQHIYSSSLFIQSGSAAEFKTGVTASEITVEGTVYATEYKKLDGSLITGTGGIEFFAGSGSGISRSLAEGGPFSQDHFFSIEGNNKVTQNGIDVLKDGLIKIETTGSLTFLPNYFNFIKVGNNGEDLTTVQQGNQSFYTPSDIEERQAGTHRYIIYAAQTGQNGETHQVFHTVTLNAFVNEAPVIVPEDNEQFTIPIIHDNNIGSVIVHSTESTDANIEAGEEDFFTKYKVAKINAGGDVSDTTNNPSYELNVISHLFENNELTSTTGIPASSFFFTASLDSFNLLKKDNSYANLDRTFIIQTPDPQLSSFDVTIEDNYPNDITNAGSTKVNYIINVTPPNKANIENSRVEFELSGFTNELTSTLEQTLLYDFDHTFSSSSIENLNDRYTSSLVRLKALTNIIEPEDGLNPPFNHYTKFRIQTQSLGNNILHSNDTLAYFRINGNEQTASAVDLSNINGIYSTPTESNGFKSFEFYPNYTNNTESLIVGTVNENLTLLNNTNNVQHGTNNHFQASINNSPSTLKLKRPPNIDISDIDIEVVNGSYEPTLSHKLTSSLLYGFTSSLLSTQTQSLITDIYDTSTSFRTVEMLDKFLTQSVVKVRVKAKITEPFGPTHNNIITTLDDSNGKSEIFNFSSESLTFFTNSPTHEDVNGQELLVGRYTSSWKEFKFEHKNENYEFGVSFNNPSPNVGLTIAEYTSASITMSNAEPIKINNIKVEIESGSYNTNEGHPNLTSSLLYGLTSSLLSSQLEDLLQNPIADGTSNPNYLDYRNQSIVRARIKTTITEPFGPSTSIISASIISPNLSISETILNADNDIIFEPPIILSSNNNQNVTEYTFNTLDDSINPSSILPLSQINVTKIEIRGSLAPSIPFPNQTIDNLTIGDIEFKDLFQTNQNSDLSKNIIGKLGTSTTDANGNTYGNSNPFTPIFSGNQPVNMLNGIVPISSKIRGFVNTLFYKITFAEPLSVSNPYSSSLISLQPDEDTVLDPNQTPSYDNDNKLISSYTSSFIEIPNISSGSFNFLHNFTSASTTHTTSIDLSNLKTSVVSMSAVEPTLFSNIKYEIETHGYSDEGTLSSVRTVLYGDLDTSNHTYETSESATWNDDTLRSITLASHSVSRFRILTDIKEPFGPGISLPNFTLKLNSQDNETYKENVGSNFNVIPHQNTSNFTHNEGSISSSKSTYDNNKKLNTSFTSSWIGKSIDSPNIKNKEDLETYELSSSISYTMNNNWEPNKFEITDFSNDTTLQLLNHDKTYFNIISHLTETNGYSEESTTSTTRTVLYGDPSVTNDTSQSKIWTNHDNKVPYASHSVTRFKTFTRVIEPIGPLHADSSFIKTFEPEDATYSDIENSFSFNSSSTSHFASIPNFVDDKLELYFETNWVGQSLSSSNQDGYTWTYTGSFFSSNPRGHVETLNSSNDKSQILIKDTPDVIITRGIPLIETFGDSEIGVDNQNTANFANQNRTLLAGNINTIGSSENLIESTTASAVLRIQNQLKITEPLGYAHKNITSSKFIIKNTDGSTLTNGPEINNIFEYNTSSANLHTSGYDENFLLTSSYTSSFDSGGLALPENGYVYQHDSVDFSFETPNEESLNANNTSKQLAFEVNTSPAVQITNFFIEVENNNSGSNVGNRSSRSTQILYGNTRTENNVTTNNTYPNDDSKNQLVSARILLSCLDPIGTTHFTPTVVIKGAEIEPSITFNTESSPNYSVTEDADTSNGVLAHYTSSFFPLKFAAGNNQILSASASKVDDLGTVFTTSSNSNEIDIDVAAAPTTTINVTDLTLGGEIFSNNFIYKVSHTSNQTITIDPVFSVGEPTKRTMANVVFDANLDIRFNENSTDHNFINENPSNGTGSLEIDISNVQSNTSPKTFNAISTVSALFDSDSDSFTEVITIIPAQPQVMNGNDWTKSFTNHNSLGIGASNLYTAALPSDLSSYKSGESAGDVVTNIFITSKSDGTGNNYNITLNTPSNYTGDYGDTNRAYGYGDTGSLVVKINDNIVVNANLATNFHPNDNDGDQTLNGYDNGGFTDGTANFSSPYAGEGNLTLLKVSPFNGVSQSISYEGNNYPNGYQAWNASLNITAKLQEGYNKVEFEHRIFPGTTHSLNTVEWYYDDGLLNPVIDTTKTLTLTDFGEATQSLSGISYFVKNSSFTASIDNVFLNIANKTYRNTSNIIAKISEADISNGIQITPSIDQNPSFANNLEFQLNTVNNTNGLILSNGNSLVPTTTATGSIQNILIKGIDTISNNGGKGELREAKIELAVRNNYNNGDNWSLVFHNFPIGRFIDGDEFNDSATDLIEDFTLESRRLLENTMTDIYIQGITDFSPLLTGDFISTDSIVDKKELQQIVGGTLEYPPNLDYNDYSGVTITQPSNYGYNVNFETSHNTRHYYRAFQFNSLSSNQSNYLTDQQGFSAAQFSANSKFTVHIEYDGIDSSEAIRSFGLNLEEEEPNGGFDTNTQLLSNTTNNVSILVRLPGSKISSGQSDSNPGTSWGVINNVTLNIFDFNNPGSNFFSALDSNDSTPFIHNTTNKKISIKCIFPNTYRIHKTQGVVLVKILMSPGAVGVTSGNPIKITKIELEGR